MAERKTKQKGRPTKHTPEVTARICQALRTGNTRQCSALYGGITKQTFYEWLNNIPDFSDAVTRAEAECEAENVAILKKAAVGWDTKTTRTKTKTYQEVVNGTDGKPLAGKDGQPVTKTITETETVVTSGHEFDWRAPLEWLKRRRRDDWSERIETTGANGGAMQIESPAMTAAAKELHEWREQMKRGLE